MNLRLAVLCVAVGACAVAGLSAADRGERALRAHWVSPASLETPDAVRRMVETAQVNGYDALFVPVRAAAGAFDPLADVLALTRNRGLRVHAWLSVNLVARADELPSSRDSIVYQQPAWLMVPRELAPELLAVDVRSPEYLGRLARWTRAHTDRVDGLYVSPLHAGAQARLAQEVKDLLTRYAVDGVHLDGLRFPAADFDYSRAAMDTFRAAVRPTLPAAERLRIDRVETIDPFAYAEELPEQWRLFRQTQLTALVTRLRSTARAVRPEALVSASVIPDVELAARETFQDWRTWIDNGFIDALSPATAPGVPSLTPLLAQLEALAGSRPVWVRD